MKLSFPWLEIEGTRSFVKKTRIDLASAGNGFHFVKGKNLHEPRLGSNGAGKSTIWGALTWCLYGKTLAGLTKPDLKPWYGEAETAVSVAVQRDYSIRVVCRRSGRITIDGKTAGQEQIDKLLGYMPLHVFGHTFLFAQGRPLFFDLEPAKKMQLFTQMLDMDRWDKRSEEASVLAKKIAGIDIPALSARIDLLCDEDERAEDDLERLQDESNRWSDSARAKQEDSEDQLRQFRRDLEVVSKRWGDADLALEAAGTELRPQQKTVDALSNDLRTIESFHNGLVISAQANIRRLVAEIDALGNGNTCPTCGQNVKGSALERHHNELKKQVTENRNKIKNDKSQAKIEAMRKKLEAAIKLRDKFAQKVEDAHTALDRLGPQKAELETKIRSIASQLKEREDERNPYIDQIQALKKRRSEINKEIRKGESDLRVMEADAERAKFWIKGFKEVKLYQLEDVLQELEIVSNNMLDEFGLENWEIRYEVERESKNGSTQRGLHVMILSPDNDEMVKWESWSGGEGQRLRIIGALALSEVLLNNAGIEAGILVLDEPSQHLSGEGVSDICQYLSEYSYQQEKQIWLADHTVIEGSYFDSTLLVVKDKDGSRIVGPRT